jgi:chromosome segregation ATPase
MTTDAAADGLRARISRQSEDALGRLAQELLESPFVSSALSRAFDAREKAAQAQEVAMGALNLPSAGDLERLTRRVRSVSQRLEGVEDALDRIDERVGSIGGTAALSERLATIEGQLTAFAGQLSELAARLATQPAPAAEAAPSPAAPADAEAELVATVFDTPDFGGAEVRVTPPRARRSTRARAAAARKRATSRRRA